MKRQRVILYVAICLDWCHGFVVTSQRRSWHKPMSVGPAGSSRLPTSESILSSLLSHRVPKGVLEGAKKNDMHEFDYDPYASDKNFYESIDFPDSNSDGGMVSSDSVDSFFSVVNQRSHQSDPEQRKLEAAIDSFLSGGFDQIDESAPAPHPDLTPAQVVEQSLRALRDLDRSTLNHGAAVFQRFLVPLTRAQRWGDSLRSSDMDPWKEIQRGALTASMLAGSIRASKFSALLDWKSLDVSEGAFDPNTEMVGNPSVAFVNAALYFKRGLAPVLIQFTLQRVGGLWLIDTARKCRMDLFTESAEGERSF